MIFSFSTIISTRLFKKANKQDILSILGQRKLSNLYFQKVSKLKSTKSTKKLFKISTKSMKNVKGSKKIFKKSRKRKKRKRKASLKSSNPKLKINWFRPTLSSNPKINKLVSFKKSCQSSRKTWTNFSLKIKIWRQKTFKKVKLFKASINSLKKRGKNVKSFRILLLNPKNKSKKFFLPIRNKWKSGLQSIKTGQLQSRVCKKKSKAKIKKLLI